MGRRPEQEGQEWELVSHVQGQTKAPGRAGRHRAENGQGEAGFPPRPGKDLGERGCRPGPWCAEGWRDVGSAGDMLKATLAVKYLLLTGRG